MPSSRRPYTSRPGNTMPARSSTRSSWRGGSTWYGSCSKNAFASSFGSLQVRNEIAVLKRVSKGHQNIVTLHDYFEVQGIRCYHPRPIAHHAPIIRPPTIFISVSISARAASSSTVYAPKGITLRRKPPLSFTTSTCLNIACTVTLRTSFVQLWQPWLTFTIAVSCTEVRIAPAFASSWANIVAIAQI